MAESVTAKAYTVFDALMAAGWRCRVQRSDLVTRAAVPVLLARWSERYGNAPTPRSSLDVKSALRLSDLADGLTSLMMTLIGQANDTMAALEAELTATGITAPAGEFSERVVIWLRRWALKGSSPSAEERDEFVAGLVRGVGRPCPIGVADFVAHFATSYDKAWSSRGAANLRRYPPEAVDLGSNRRPELARPLPGRSDWSRGSDRPVYQRYRLWFKRSAETSPTRCQRAQCRRPTAASVEDPGGVEVWRACCVYGLGLPEHQQILRSIAIGVASPSGGERGWASWDSWANPCSPISLDGEFDAELADATASAVAAWSGSDVGAPLVRTYGYAAVAGPLSAAVVRKSWMMLLGYERAFAEPMRRCGIPKLLRTALYRHAPDAIRDWMRGEWGTDPQPLDEGGVGSPEVLLWMRRRERTLELLAGRPSLAQAILDDDQWWRDAYRSLTDRAAGTAALPTDEVRLAILDLMKAMTDE